MRAITRTDPTRPSGQVQGPFVSSSRSRPDHFQSYYLPSGLHRRLPCMGLPPLTAIAALIYLLVSPAPTAFAQTFKPVFSMQYTRSVGTPATASDEFTACDPGGSFRLVVLNGPGGQWRISSGSIFVNGVEVVKEQEFNQQVERIERPLSNVGLSNSLEVRLRSHPGAAIEITVEGIQSCGIQITAPAPGSTLTDPIVLVRGTVPVPPGGEVGVTVNGILALVDAGQFAALVPVDPDVTTLTAIASDATGALSSDIIAVVVRPSTSELPLLFQVAPAVGVAPLTVDFTFSSRVSITQISLDLQGDGTVDFQGPSLEGQVFTYGTPGLYLPTVSATDAAGVTHRATTPIRVDDPAVFDALLQAKWKGLKTALQGLDLPTALRFIASEARDTYQQLFTELAPLLATVGASLGDIRFVEVREDLAEYELLVAEDGQTISYYVEFIRDADGLWRVNFF